MATLLPAAIVLIALFLWYLLVEVPREVYRTAAGVPVLVPRLPLITTPAPIHSQAVSFKVQVAMFIRDLMVFASERQDYRLHGHTASETNAASAVIFRDRFFARWDGIVSELRRRGLADDELRGFESRLGPELNPDQLNLLIERLKLAAGVLE